MDNILNTITPDSGVYLFDDFKYSENNYNLRKQIYSPIFSMNPNKGDIYFRLNKKNKSARVHIFTGERTKFYDQDFGAGEEEYGCPFVDVTKFLDHLIGDKSLHTMLKRLYNFGMKFNIKIVNYG